MSNTTEDKMALKAKASATWAMLKEWGTSDYLLVKDFLLEHKAWTLRAALIALTIIIAWPFIATFMRGTGGVPTTTPISNHVILRNLGLMAAGIVGVGLAWWRAKSLGTQARVAEQGLITDRFIKASEQLGHKEMAVRLGAIHSLWRIAMDSQAQNDKTAVLDMLCAFVRNPTALGASSKIEQELTSNLNECIQCQTEDNRPDQTKQILRIDVQSIVTLIGTRLSDLKLQQRYVCNFSYAQLAHCQLDGANFERAIFDRANLLEANFMRANLKQACIAGANLMRASLQFTNLEDAWIWMTNLERASLLKANLQRASLSGANLTSAHLLEANLEQAELFDANLNKAILFKTNLRQAQLVGANLEEAGFRETQLNETQLAGANLKGATQLTQEQLNQIAPLHEPILNLPEGLTIPESKVEYGAPPFPEEDNTSG